MPVDESFLADLGIWRIPTPVPFLEAGGPANVYALADENGGFTLFDCAVGTDEGLRALRDGVERAGFAMRQLNRIVVSHGHIDHYGNAQTLSEETGCPVLVHDADLEKVCGDGRWHLQLQQHLDYFLKLGVPREVLDQMLERAFRNRPLARQVERHRVQSLQPGTRFTFAHFQAEVLHLPGHTPGLVCLHAPAHKLLFADDHVLARVSPNPLLDLSQGEGETKFKALISYLRSVEAVTALELDCVLPGHGEAFSGHRSLLAGLMQFYARRQEKLLKRITDSPASVYELVKAVFLRVDLGRLYLMLSEVLGHLEVMEGDGRVRRHVDEAGLFRFAR